MTADNHWLDPTIAAWLADESTFTTSETHRAISAAIRRTPQRRGLRPADIVRLGRFLVVSALLAGAAALAIVGGGFSQFDPSPTPASSEAAGSPPPPTRSEAILELGAQRIRFSFERPVAWDITRVEREDGAGLVMFASAWDDEWYGSGLRDSADPAAHGITIANVTGATEHGSTVFRPVFGEHAEEFVRGLDGSDFFVADDVRPAIVGGLPGWTTRVRLEGDWWSHIDVYPPGTRTGSVEFGPPNVTWFVDVGGAVVAVVVWGNTTETMEDWLPRAMPFVESIRFESASPSSSPR